MTKSAQHRFSNPNIWYGRGKILYRSIEEAASVVDDVFTSVQAGSYIPQTDYARDQVEIIQTYLPFLKAFTGLVYDVLREDLQGAIFSWEQGQNFCGTYRRIVMCISAIQLAALSILSFSRQLTLTNGCLMNLQHYSGSVHQNICGRTLIIHCPTT